MDGRLAGVVRASAVVRASNSNCGQECAILQAVGDPNGLDPTCNVTATDRVDIRAEGALTGVTLQLGKLRNSFLIALIGVTVANYLLTRLWAGATCLAADRTRTAIEDQGTPSAR